MRRVFIILAAALAAFACFGGCAPGEPPPAPARPVLEAPPPPAPGGDAGAPKAPARAKLPPLENAYIQSLADGAVDSLGLKGLTDREKIRAAYRWMIERVYFADPVGQDCWRWRGGQTEPPPYLENRALSPLAFGIGSCEDYAAAMTLLLRRMGFEARYLPGLTVSVKREYIDHAWALVRLEGRWYHLDPQLEANVMRQNRLEYRYFLKDDNTMLADHIWGERWLAYGLAGKEPLTAAQIEEIREAHCPPPCPQAAPQEPPERARPAPPPDRGAIERALARERADYEREHGPLPPLELHLSPPVFGERATPASGIHTAGLAPAAAPGGAPRYGRRFLSGGEAALYDRMASLARGWEAGRPEPPPAPVKKERLLEIWALARDDYPEFYWADCVTEEGADGMAAAFSLEARAPLTVEAARARQEQIDRAAGAVLREIPRGDPFETGLGIHDALAGSVRYEGAPGVPDVENLYGALVLGRGVCEAYSRGYQYLMQLCGLECVYLRGSTTWGTRHAWNAVRLPDGWYEVDVTWDRGRREGEVYHDYLFVTTGEMAREHLPEEGQYPALPEAVNTAQNYYVRKGYVAARPDGEPESFATGFARQLAGRALPEEYGEVFLELKVPATGAQFERAREGFVGRVFEVLAAVDEAARAEGIAARVKTTERVALSYNDAAQVLTLTPLVRRAAREQEGTA